MVKKEVFEWIKAGRKTIELRTGKAKAGDQAVFQCGRNILKCRIISKDEVNLSALLHNLNWKNVCLAVVAPELGVS
jgi:ASC-1-like (ASCH) protein